MDAQHGFEAPQSPHEDRGCCFIEAELLVWERSFLPNIMIEVFLVDDQDEVASKRNEVQVFFCQQKCVKLLLPLFDMDRNENTSIEFHVLGTFFQECATRCEFHDQKIIMFVYL